MPTVIGQDTSIKKRITCKNCGAVIEYLPIDVRVISKGKDYDGGSYCYNGFPCPQCSKEVITSSY